MFLAHVHRRSSGPETWWLLFSGPRPGWGEAVPGCWQWGNPAKDRTTEIGPGVVCLGPNQVFSGTTSGMMQIQIEGCRLSSGKSLQGIRQWAPQGLLSIARLTHLVRTKLSPGPISVVWSPVFSPRAVRPCGQAQPRPNPIVVLRRAVYLSLGPLLQHGDSLSAYLSIVHTAITCTVPFSGHLCALCAKSVLCVSCYKLSWL